MEATASLTCRAGVGIEALCKVAGVSKRSLCKLFDSEDELLAASLERGFFAYVAALLPAADDGRSPRERILHVFEQVELRAGGPEAQGCQYLAVQIKLKDRSHPAGRVAHRVKEDLTGFFRARPPGAARAIPACWPGSSASFSMGPTPALAGLRRADRQVRDVEAQMRDTLAAARTALTALPGLGP